VILEHQDLQPVVEVLLGDIYARSGGLRLDDREWFANMRPPSLSGSRLSNWLSAML